MVDVRVTNLRKEFGAITAVDDINFTVKHGEFITIVGPSGSGKTTVIRMLAGLEQPTSGTIYLGDSDITDSPPQERNVAMLFQDVALYPHMSVRENIGYGLKIEGIEAENRNEKVEEVADLLQIGDQLDKKPGDLSGGQQQRAALGRSMARDPSVFLFDEPMSDLDAKLKAELRPLILEVTRDIGCPTIYVTHDQLEAMTLSDRIIVMRQGSIVQVGTPDEVYSKPNSTFVGQFIGQPEMQFFDGVVGTSDDDSLTIGPWDFTHQGRLADRANETVTVGIRPNHLKVSRRSDSRNGDGLHAQHHLDEPLGHQTISYFESDVGRVTVVTDADFQGDADTEYLITADASDAIFFDKESGTRLA